MCYKQYIILNNMSQAKRQAFKDMHEMGISLSVFIYETDILLLTRVSIEIEKPDFRHFNKKDVHKL